jgi:polar amino acid transport system substrate-binding protein
MRVNRSYFVVIAVLTAGALGVAAAAAAVTPPPNIKSAGKIVFCSDITYPPEESYQGTKAVGSDIDIGTGIAAQMGVKATFKNTTFDSIIAALNA